MAATGFSLYLFKEARSKKKQEARPFSFNYLASWLLSSCVFKKDGASIPAAVQSTGHKYNLLAKLIK